MLQIRCPHCGPRAEIEFVCGGEVIDRPLDPVTFTATEWRAYLSERTNAKGIAHERWWHAQGCRLWFTVYRDTTTHAFVGPVDPSAP